jgi:cytoskeletal protein RodZ
MSELGRLLVQARTAKELTLADVEATTRIRQKYLEALESGSYEVLPRGATARGFLRTYARFLGLDADAALRLYEQESHDTGETISIAEPGHPRLTDYRPLEVELINPETRDGWWRWAVALVIVVALAAGGWWLLTLNPGWNPLVAFRPAPTGTATPTPSATLPGLVQPGRGRASATATATPWVVTATPPPPTPTATPLPASPTSDLLPLPTPTLPATPTPTPRPTATPEVVQVRIVLTMRITQRAWVRVVVDGKDVVGERGASLEAGQTQTWEADNSIFIRTGNAGGVVLTLNGEELGAMGKVGEVAERTWVVDQGEVTETTPFVPTRTPVATVTPTPAG